MGIIYPVEQLMYSRQHVLYSNAVQTGAFKQNGTTCNHECSTYMFECLSMQQKVVTLIKDGRPWSMLFCLKMLTMFVFIGHVWSTFMNLIITWLWSSMESCVVSSRNVKEWNIGQYGSKPYRNAVDPVLIEEFQFEISRASRKTFAQTNYDAISCYNRIIPNLAMLVSRKFGVSKATALTNAETLD